MPATTRLTQPHLVILAHVRASPAVAPMAGTLAQWDDEQLARRLFSNYRDGKGLRLTLFGHHVLQRCFECFEFEGQGLLFPSQFLFLDRRAKMPYYCDARCLALYDRLFAVQLRLADGSLATLMEVDTLD